MKRQIIALGGGGFSMEPDNLLLDEYVLKQARKETPKVCFIATASGDSDNYIVRFYTSFLKLSCTPAHLSLFRLHTKDLQDFILSQDVIYVGGGNTKSLMALWREWGLDTYLRTAWENGLILAGISAGSLCWFEEGVSDYFPGELNRLQCLGFLKGSNCPHYDSEINRRPTYQKLILSGEIAEGVAADDGVALHYINTELRHVVSSRPHARAYAVTKKSGEVVEEVLDTVYLGK
jgi:dipeptidase E